MVGHGPRRRQVARGLSLLAVGALATRGGRARAQAVAKLATVAPDGTPWAEQLARLRARVKAATGDGLRISAYLGGGLGDENVTASETRRGAIQIWGGSTAALASLVPELALFELPYLFRSAAEADHVIDEVVAADLDAALARRGLQRLFWSENGFRSFGTRFGPVTGPADLAGKKMRSQEHAIHIAMYRALGASPVPIAVTEVLSSLQTRVVDGFDQTPLFSFAASWYQGIGHFSLSQHIYQPAVVVANRDWFVKLPRAQQEALTADARAEAARGRRDVRELEPLLIENLAAAKVKVHRLDEPQRAALARACERVHAEWLKGKGKATAPLFRKIQAGLRALRGER